MSERNAAGRFAPGHSGNPGGRSATRCRALAQETTEEALRSAGRVIDGEVIEDDHGGTGNAERA